jgi:hypothetical protein
MAVPSILEHEFHVNSSAVHKVLALSSFRGDRHLCRDQPSEGIPQLRFKGEHK